MSAPHPWHARAEELADWALDRFFVRRDRYGGYYRAGGETRKCARPQAGAVPGAVTRSVLLRHFRARRPDDVVGAYLLTSEPSVGRAVAVDIDAHDPSADPEANARYGTVLYAHLVELGFRPLLARWGGSCHLYALFAADQPGAALHRFGRHLVAGAGVETFPKQPSVPKDGFGNWLRVIGRHHTRDQWAEVFDGRTWLAGAPAVAHLLALTGDEISLERDAEADGPPPAHAPAPSRPHAPAPVDVLAEYSRSVTLDEVVGWHERAGHTVVRRRPDRVEFRRAGKKGSESFNVMLCGGAPITYNFSANAGIPPARGLSPAQVRCFYELGSCDPAALCRFADGLRLAAGLPPRVRRAPAAAAGADPAPGSVEERLAALERQCARLKRENWELARAVLALQKRAAIGGYRVGS